MLKPINKTVEVTSPKPLYIPSKWRGKFNLNSGQYVSVRLQGDSLIIKKEVSETDMLCVVGKKGNINIPAEAKQALTWKRVQSLEVYVDEDEEKLVLKPF